jgi:hypothetical protein
VVGSADSTRASEAGLSASAIASAIAMSVTEVLQRITTALDRSGIAYMLSGSFGSAFYGAPRSTQDIDFVIVAAPAQLRVFVQSLSGDQCYADLDAALDACRRQSMFNVIDLATGWKIDLIMCKTRAFSQEEFRRRHTVILQGISLFVASPEDIILSKLEWSKLAQSNRHIEDVAGILRIRWESLDRSYLRKWIIELGLESEWNRARKDAGIID